MFSEVAMTRNVFFFEDLMISSFLDVPKNIS